MKYSRPAHNWLLFLCASAALLLIRSECSYVYPINEWYDPNCFMTVGRGMMNGLVPYRDLFEQKGPVVFLMHGFAELVTPGSFHGVYWLEVAALTFGLWFAYKIAALYTQANRARVIAIVFATMTVCSLAFFKGDSMEEFALPMMLMGLYHLTRALKRGGLHTLTLPIIFANGVCAGMVLWMKYSLLGFWFAFMATVFFTLCARREIMRAFLACGCFLGGMALATAPWLIYFGANGAIYDWLYTYFFVNLTVYARQSLPLRAVNMLIGILRNAFINPLSSFLIIWHIVKRARGEGDFITRYLCLILTVCALAFTYYGPNRFPYYQLIVFPMALFGLIDVFDAILKLLPERTPFARVRLAALGVCVIMLVNASVNALIVLYKGDKLVQNAFAEVINEEPDSTMLQYGFLDAGFYFAADKLPTERYFCGLNLDPERYPALSEAQNSAIAERRVDFIVYEIELNADPLDTGIPLLNQNYDYIMDGSIYKGMEGIRRYALYRAKPLLDE